MTRTLRTLLPRPNRETLLWGGLVLNAELLAVLAYVAVVQPTITGERYFVYPFLWINVGVWAVLRTNPVARSERHRYVAAALAAGYFLVLAATSGIIGLGSAQIGWNVAWLPPGWGPALTYGGEQFRLALLPYKVIGYAALSYLVYATILDAAASVVSGLLGLISCVSCTWPVAASLLTSVLGGSTLAVSGVYALSYDLSTAVFLVTVGLLYWRPFGVR